MTTKKARNRNRGSSAVTHRRAGPSKVQRAREFVLDYIRKHGHGPGYTEIQRATNVGDTSALFAKLAKDGIITYTRGDYSSARLTDRPGPGLMATRPIAPAIGGTREMIPLNVALPREVLEQVKAKLVEDAHNIDTQIRAVDAALAMG